MSPEFKKIRSIVYKYCTVEVFENEANTSNNALVKKLRADSFHGTTAVNL
jgi:hypothetical protein